MKYNLSLRLIRPYSDTGANMKNKYYKQKKIFIKKFILISCQEAIFYDF